MLSLVYVSSAVVPFTDPQLRQLLAQSREDNARSGITGMLVYKDGNFMQMIEGEEAAVRNLQTKIRRDPRHCGLVQLLCETTEARQFSDWSMGFRNLESPELLEMPGFSPFLNYALTGREFRDDPTLAQKLLLSFKKNM